MKGKALIGYILLTYTAGIFIFILVASHFVFFDSAFVCKSSQHKNTLTKHLPHFRPDFSSFTVAKEKKSAFFDYLSPFIAKQNVLLLEKRHKLQQLSKQYQQSGKLTKSKLKQLQMLKDEFNIEPETSTQESIKLLLNRINIIPKALVLAQAANESAWGTSRFAIEANNFFGQWCFKKGCGLVPNQRKDGSVHEVRKFKTAEDSVISYFRNINTHDAYQYLRDIRENAAKDDIAITGNLLAAGLTKYSERGEHYVKELRSMIQFNKLE